MKKGTVGVLALVTGFFMGISIIAESAEAAVRKTRKYVEDYRRHADQLSKKHMQMFLLMNQWVGIKQKSKTFASFFERYGYHRIVIYGMSYVGTTLIEELRGTGIEIVFGIDQKADILDKSIDIFTVEDILKNLKVLEKVDVIVVTAITCYQEIVKKLGRETDCPIVSIEEILCEI